MADVSVSTIRDIEAGRHKPSLITCAKLAVALEMPMEEIDECKEQAEENRIGPNHTLAARA